MATTTTIDLPLLFNETPERIRARLLARLPEAWAREPGAWSRDMVELMVGEASILWEELNRVSRQTFIATADGLFLDAHAASYGIVRGGGSKAQTVVRFTAPAATAIPAATVVEMPATDPDADRIRFQTTNTVTRIVGPEGYADIDAVAQDIGADRNVPANSLTLLGQAVPNVTAVTNPSSAFGGENPQDDDALRADVFDEARLPIGAGNELDYEILAKRIPGVVLATAQGLWDTSGVTPGTGDGNNTVAITIRGQDGVPADWQLVQAAQREIDPSRQLIALLEEGEPWTAITGTAPTWVASAPQTGEKVLHISRASAGTSTVSLVRRMDLSRFNSDDDDFWLWMRSSNWAVVANTSKVRFLQDAANYFEMPFGPTDPSPGITKPTSGSSWWLGRMRKANFAMVGTPDWDAITEVQIDLVTTAAGDLDADYWSIRDSSGATGEGTAGIGHAVTIFTVVPKAINVTATVTLATGYTLSGAPGTTNATVLITKALSDFLRAQKPGQTIRLVDINNAIHDTPGVVDFAVSVPSGNVPVTLNQYAVLGAIALS